MPPTPAQPTVQASDGTALDPSVVNLAKAIRTQESGNNYTKSGDAGTSVGAYQFNNGGAPVPKGGVPANYKAWATQYGVDPNDFSPINQDKVAYARLLDFKNRGYTPAQSAAAWNAGEGHVNDWQTHKGSTTINGQTISYDTPAYVDKVINTFRALKSGQQPLDGGQNAPGGATGAGTAPDATQGGYQPLFTASASDNPLVAGAKALGNVIPSAFNFAKNAVSAINPINIAQNLAAIPGAFSSALAANQGDVGKTLGAAAEALPGEAYKAIVPKGTQQLIAGDVGGAAKTFTEDPFGQVAPYAFAAKGAGELLDKTGATSGAGAAVDTAISKAGQLVTKPVGYAFGKTAGAVGDIASGATRYATAKATGLNPETISQIAETPEAFTPENIGSATRQTLGQELYGKYQERVASQGETAAAYKPIRASEAPVQVDPNFLQDSIAETTGLQLKKGQWTPTKSSSVDSPTDVTKVQRLYDAWKDTFKGGTMTADDFLTLRGKLAKLANYEGVGKSNELESATSRMRGKLNTEYRDQIPGLSELDAQNTAQMGDLKTLFKGIVDRQGHLTDGAYNLVANATNRGNMAKLARLEEISPGITLKIRQLKAMEDIQNIHKVGTYTKSLAEGGGIAGLGAGLATLNIPLIVGSIATLMLTQPEVAVRMIRGYGKYAAPIAGRVVDALKKGGAAVNQLPERAPAQMLGAFGPRQPSAAAAQ